MVVVMSRTASRKARTPCAGTRPVAIGLRPHCKEANEARLKMGVLAYNLPHLIRRFYLLSEEVRRSIEWLIRRLIKVGAKVVYRGRIWPVHVASAFPLAHHYRAILGFG